MSFWICGMINIESFKISLVLHRSRFFFPVRLCLAYSHTVDVHRETKTKYEISIHFFRFLHRRKPFTVYVVFFSYCFFFCVFFSQTKAATDKLAEIKQHKISSFGWCGREYWWYEEFKTSSNDKWMCSTNRQKKSQIQE